MKLFGMQSNPRKIKGGRVVSGWTAQPIRKQRGSGLNGDNVPVSNVRAVRSRTAEFNKH